MNRRLGMNVPARLNYRLGMDPPARLDPRLQLDPAATPAFRLHRGAQQPDQLQVKRRDNQADGGVQSHAQAKANSAA